MVEEVQGACATNDIAPTDGNLSMNPVSDKPLQAEPMALGGNTYV